jgi:hypothetical protein
MKKLLLTVAAIAMLATPVAFADNQSGSECALIAAGVLIVASGFGGDAVASIASTGLVRETVTSCNGGG